MPVGRKRLIFVMDNSPAFRWRVEAAKLNGAVFSSSEISSNRTPPSTCHVVLGSMTSQSLYCALGMSHSQPDLRLAAIGQCDILKQK
jgi:hypothetical protein